MRTRGPRPAARPDGGVRPVARSDGGARPPVAHRDGGAATHGTGGGHPTHSYWLQAHSPTVEGRVMRVPETFEKLLTEADRDLGCGDDVCRI